MKGGDAMTVRDPARAREAAFRLRHLLGFHEERVRGEAWPGGPVCDVTVRHPIYESEEEPMTDRAENIKKTKARLVELEHATGIKLRDGDLWSVEGKILLHWVEDMPRPLEDPPVARTPRDAITFLEGWRAAMNHFA